MRTILQRSKESAHIRITTIRDMPEGSSGLHEKLFESNIRTAYISGGYDKTFHLYGKLGM
jgi:hypothetical protein